MWSMGKIATFVVLLTLFVTSSFILLVLFAISCIGSSNRLTNVEFGQPPRVVYIAGVDTELDFSDTTLFLTQAGGDRWEDPFYYMRGVTVMHLIDFNTPGVYEVEVRKRSGSSYFYLHFFVQVIDEEIFDRLREGVG